MLFKDREFYKVYINDMDNIIKENIEPSAYINNLRAKEDCHKYLSAPNKYIFICCDNYTTNSFGWIFGWMPQNDNGDYVGSGYDYFIRDGYKYGGVCASSNYLRKLKLKEIDIERVK